MHKARAAGRFLAGAFGVGAVTFAVNANAAFFGWRSAVACYAESHNGTLYEATHYSHWALANESTTNPSYLYCPIDDNSLNPSGTNGTKAYISNLYVYGYVHSPTSGVSVTTCVDLRDSDTGGACAAAVTKNTVGNYALAPNRTYWDNTHSSDFGYIYVTLGYNQGGTNAPNTMQGYYFAWP